MTGRTVKLAPCYRFLFLSHTHAHNTFSPFPSLSLFLSLLFFSCHSRRHWSPTYCIRLCTLTSSSLPLFLSSFSLHPFFAYSPLRNVSTRRGKKEQTGKSPTKVRASDASQSCKSVVGRGRRRVEGRNGMEIYKEMPKMHRTLSLLSDRSHNGEVVCACVPQQSLDTSLRTFMLQLAPGFVAIEAESWAEVSRRDRATNLGSDLSAPRQERR